MPPRRRARLSSRPYSAVAAAEQCPRGWLAVRRSRPSKRARRVVTTIPEGDGDGDDGTPLTDEILVGIFAGLPDFPDLVRCAATCRRWCRLVSGEAAFICRAAARRWTPRIRSLALGFFYSPRHGAAPRFAATASATRRRLGLRQPSLNALVEGLDDGLFDASRLVASRNGLVVVQLHRRKRERAVKLCVCNPMTGEVTVLPPLGGKEIVSPFACTVLTADDYRNDGGGGEISPVSEPPSSSSSYNLLLVYARRGFMACRTYVSDGGGRWGPEAKVWNAAPLRNKAMASMAATGAVVVGNVAYWHTNSIVFGVRLDTLHAEHVAMPVSGNDPAGNTLLGVSPDGRLRVVQVVESRCPTRTPINRWVGISVDTREAAGRGWDPERIEVVGRFLPAETTWLKLRWMCEKSGVVFFAAGCGDQRSDLYAMSLDKQEVEKVASHHGGGGGGVPSSWADLHGYEMDRTSYLSSLAMDDDDT